MAEPLKAALAHVGVQQRVKVLRAGHTQTHACTYINIILALSRINFFGSI